MPVPSPLLMNAAVVCCLNRNVWRQCFRIMKFACRARTEVRRLPWRVGTKTPAHNRVETS